MPDLTIQSLTPTVCRLMGIPNPDHSSPVYLQEIVTYANGILQSTPISKCFIFCPDAIGNHIYKHDRIHFENIFQIASLPVFLSAVCPTVTPVNFASMFTGADPSIHGIQKYHKPVLKLSTIFDSLVAQKRRVAIVAVAKSSIDTIFRERAVDYFSESYDNEVLMRCLSLIENNSHDFIVAYQQEYDDILHKNNVFSDKAIMAVKNHISAFTQISKQMDKYWNANNRLLAFSPDHGAHNINPDQGTHGDDIPEDKEVYHFYSIRKGVKA